MSIFYSRKHPGKNSKGNLPQLMIWVRISKTDTGTFIIYMSNSIGISIVA